MTPMVENPDGPGRDDGVSPRGAHALRAAMDRLLAGQPTRTDGRLIKDNLWKEAGVSRATMNRAHTVMAEWDSRVAERDGLTPGQARRDAELAELRAKLADKTRECTALEQRLDAAASAIAALHHDSTLLRQELARAGKLATLEPRRGQPPQRAHEHSSGHPWPWRTE